MKRLLTALLALCMLASLCACGASDAQGGTTSNTPQGTQGSDATTEPTEESTAPQTDPEGKVTLESCSFTEEVTAADGECVSIYYPDKNGKVYIDAVFSVKTDSEMSADTFKGYVMYDSVRYDLQYCVESTSGTALNDDNIQAPGGRVHLFTSVPDEAQSQELIAIINANNHEFLGKVAKKDTRTALEKKTQVKAGDKQSVMDGKVEFEVVSCKYTKVLQAQDTANTKQYTGSKPFVDLVLKVTNNLDTENGTLTDLFGYAQIGGENQRAVVRLETDNNTDLKYLSGIGIAPGKTEYIHITVSVEENQDTSNLAIRFNLGGTCYYCYAVQE